MSRHFANKGKPKSPSRGHVKKPRGRLFLRLLHGIRNAALIFLLASAGITVLFAFVPPPFTPLMLIRCGEQWSVDQPVRMRKDWTSLDRMSPHLVDAVVAAEDQLFFEHHGFDFESILSAFAINRKGKRKLGASTITQQAAKNLFLWPARSWARKGLEAYFTFLMELFWTKRRVLTVYLNIIETGNGIYGMEAASRHYFGVGADRVSRNQAALLAATLPNPRRWSPNRPTPYLLRRQAWILRQMDLRGSERVPSEPSRLRRWFRALFKSIFG